MAVVVIMVDRVLAVHMVVEDVADVVAKVATEGRVTMMVVERKLVKEDLVVVVSIGLNDMSISIG